MTTWALMSTVVAMVIYRRTIQDENRHDALADDEMHPQGLAFIAMLFGALVTAPVAYAFHIWAARVLR